jgi:D-alanine-D-alanine ligase
LYGEGIGSSRAALVSLEYALRAVKSVRKLRNIPLGVLYYADEGQDAEYSDTVIKKACERASRIIVLRPGNPGDRIVTQRRGQRKYRLTVEGPATRLGTSLRRPDPMHWMYVKLDALSKLNSRADRIAVAAQEIHTSSYPLRLPHRVTVTLLTSFPTTAAAERLETDIRELLSGSGPQWDLSLMSNRPPMPNRKTNRHLVKELKDVAARWEITIDDESSVWPSVAGLVPTDTPVLCGVGPVAGDLYTTREHVLRISLVQRTLLLSQYLLTLAAK